MNPDSASHHPATDPDSALNAHLAAAIGVDRTGGWTQLPLLRDDPADFSPVVRPDSDPRCIGPKILADEAIKVLPAGLGEHGPPPREVKR